MQPPRIASREEWLEARKAHLKEEKALTRMLDLVVARRRALPWVTIEKDYVFDTVRGRETLAELFAGKSQLIIHHLMFAPDWDAACPGCSFQAEHIDGPAQHLEHHDVRIIAVSRAPLAKLLDYRQRMGWRFEWVSSHDSEFNYDFQVSFRKDDLASCSVDYNFGTITVDPRYVHEDLPGISVFYMDQSGQVFHTYSTYARGLDMLLGGNQYLDLVPRGRQEGAVSNWPRRHDEYDDDPGS